MVEACHRGSAPKSNFLFSGSFPKSMDGTVEIKRLPPWLGASASSWRGSTLPGMLNTKFRDGPTSGECWTNWSACAVCGRQIGWETVFAETGEEFGPQVHGRWWWGQGRVSRPHGVRSYWHVSQRRCRCAVTQRSHRVIKFARGPESACSVLSVVGAKWCTLRANQTNFQKDNAQELSTR